MPYKKGKSGNPAGRPPGIVDRRVRLRELFEVESAAIVATVIAKAKEGDPAAMRLACERITPPVRETPIKIDLPPIAKAEDCATAQAVVTAAVAAGELLPSEGGAMTALIEAQRKTYEVGELSARLAAIEELLQRRGVT